MLLSPFFIVGVYYISFISLLNLVRFGFQTARRSEVACAESAGCQDTATP